MEILKNYRRQATSVFKFGFIYKYQIAGNAYSSLDALACGIPEYNKCRFISM